MATATQPDTIVYPDSDGKPMAESHVHRQLMYDVIPRLEEWFADDPTVYVNGNQFVYYVKGKPAKVLAPDVFVAFGTHKTMRVTFQTWVEGVFPSVVFEFTSSSTAAEDQGVKFETYRDVWKVKEYFLFDPREEYLDPPLQGYRLSRGKYAPIRMVKGQLTSKELGITIEQEGTAQLLLRDAETGKRLLTHHEKLLFEAERRIVVAEAKLDRTEAQLMDSEAEMARLQAEIEVLRKKS